MTSCHIVIAIILLNLSVSCLAGIGTITDQLNSPANILRKNQHVQALKGQAVEMMDSIRTQQGKIGIKFEDDTRVQINENSLLLIDEFVYEPRSKGGKLGAKIVLGTVRYASGQIAKTSPQNVALKTPTATISVRGTDFTVTVEELGQSTIILLPSCPNNKTFKIRQDIDDNCKVGEIQVETEAGSVILNRAFQATKVETKSAPPLKPVILNLTEDQINNLIILSPPKEFKESKKTTDMLNNRLDADFLLINNLDNILEKMQIQIWQEKLTYTFLRNDFINNIFDMVENLLNEKLLNEIDTVLPDYKKQSGIIAVKDDLQVSLCRDSGGDVQCITTPINQKSTIYQIQNNLEFRNRVNQGNGTIITLIQR